MAEADKGTSAKRIVLCDKNTLNTPYKDGLTSGGTYGIAYINMTSSEYGQVVYHQSGNTNIFVKKCSNKVWGSWVKVANVNDITNFNNTTLKNGKMFADGTKIAGIRDRDISNGVATERVELIGSTNSENPELHVAEYAEDGTITDLAQVIFDGTNFHFNGKKNNGEVVYKPLQTIENRVEQCFQSVSDGKAKVASAITGKGVTTASDATFDVMATNISKISKGKCISLGNGTSFNVQTVCANNGLDYTKLTKDNFIVGMSGASAVSTSVTAYAEGHTSSIGAMTLSHSYNASTGVLSVSGNSHTLTCSPQYNTGGKKTATQTFTVFAYLVYVG